MRIEKRLLWFGIKSCLYCGSIFPQSDGLCRPCSESLWQWASEDELFHQSLKNFGTYSLFQWVPGLQEVLSKLVRALKGDQKEDLWQVYAEEFWRRYLVSTPGRRAKPLLFVPSPAKNKEKDHAALLAQHLAELTSGSLCFCLSRSADAGSQKKKSRSQRQRVRLEWAENFSQEEFGRLSAGKQVVFVDDVLTTGSTALVAWKTLGNPRDFAVWTLAQRSLPCGELGDLL